MDETGWYTSSYSGYNGDCVQCKTMPGPAWRKSSYSTANGDCIQVAGRVLVRDSKDPDGPVLHFTAAEWQAFADDLKQEGR